MALGPGRKGFGGKLVKPFSCAIDWNKQVYSDILVASSVVLM